MRNTPSVSRITPIVTLCTGPSRSCEELSRETKRSGCHDVGRPGSPGQGTYEDRRSVHMRNAIVSGVAVAVVALGLALGLTGGTEGTSPTRNGSDPIMVNQNGPICPPRC